MLVRNETGISGFITARLFQTPIAVRLFIVSQKDESTFTADKLLNKPKNRQARGR